MRHNPQSGCFFHPDRECEYTMTKIPEQIERRAQKLFEDLQNGKSFAEIGARRMYYNRKIVVIRLGYTYRMIVEETGKGSWKLIGVMTHETYNSRKWRFG